MRVAYFTRLFLLLAITASIISCQKDADTVIPPVVKPKLGTTWNFQRDQFGINGQTFQSRMIALKATTEETHGGEKWLNLTDSALNSYFLLNTKTGGLYQYTNNSSNLLCKFPAAVNDMYTTYNNGGVEDFTVTEVNQAIGATTSFYGVNKYVGKKGGMDYDHIWYNESAWIVRRMTWAIAPIPGTYYLDKRWILQTIVY